MMTKTPKSWSIRVAARRPSAQHLSLDGNKETPHHMLLVNSGELVPRITTTLRISWRRNGSVSGR
jgi:hypothetical protein